MRIVLRSITPDEHIELIDGDYYHTISDPDDYECPYCEFPVFLGPGGRPPRNRKPQVFD